MGGAAAPRTGDSPAGPSTDYKGGGPLVQGSPLFRPPGALDKGDKGEGGPLKGRSPGGPQKPRRLCMILIDISRFEKK